MEGELFFMRSLQKQTQLFMKLVVALAVVTIVTVALNGMMDMSQLKIMIQETARQGMSVVIGLIAIAIACMSFQSPEKRQENKSIYLNYLAFMLIMLGFLQTVFLFPYLPAKTSVYIAAFILYFFIGLGLIIITVYRTYEIIKKAFE